MLAALRQGLKSLRGSDRSAAAAAAAEEAAEDHWTDESSDDDGDANKRDFVSRPLLARQFRPPWWPEGEKRFHYRYARRQMPYRLEQFEPSEEELQRIRDLLNAEDAGERFRLPEAILGARRRKIIIDTDVGTDADDILALLVALHLPPDDVELLAVTTNYFPTRLRQRVAHDIIHAFDWDKHPAGGPPPIVAGTGFLCGTHRPVFLHGNEGLGLRPELAGKEAIEHLWTPVPEDDTAAVDTILGLLRTHPGEITIVSIGIPTNLARCVTAAAPGEFARIVGHVVLMGGGSPLIKSSLRTDCVQKPSPFDLPEDRDAAVSCCLNNTGGEKRPVTFFPNHNTSGDTLATSVLMRSQCRVSVLAHDVTSQFWAKGRCIETLLEATRDHTDVQSGSAGDSFPEEVRVVGRLLVEWLKRRRGQRGQCPHDPLTLYEAVYASDDSGSGLDADAAARDFVAGKTPVLEYASGTFVAHEWASFMTFIPGDGPHRVAFRVRNGPKWLEWLDDALVGCVPESLRTEKSEVDLWKWD